MKNLKKNTITITALIILVVMLANSALGARGYIYVPNVDPHTRYNPLREDCFYYYGYGSCNVTKAECTGVSIGMNRWVNLGDACKRNDPPKIKMGTLQDIVAYEGEKVIIQTTCMDEDPVSIKYSGWTTTQETATGFEDAGTYKETVTCTDSFGEKVDGEFKIVIIDKNRKPLFSLINWLVESPKQNSTGNYSN